ncbi:YraN family protein [Rudaeicoccus suwonensis]|uniref:UPF0102 protein BKA23_1954 n=1 Tax=Rudaeicoccus suwonensis TaxID=657409 RepID=A0A561EBY8_9MICO|nr:YraN family protein [Rudaeicoccus suwonensis]TWE13125.1 putative endonuclease [Rudaeicoccus suwonensis]
MGSPSRQPAATDTSGASAPSGQGRPTTRLSLTKAELGRWGEDVAARHLRSGGMQVVERNWRCRDGEIDLIAVDGDCVVVVEVKTRTTEFFGSPVDAVTPVKARRLRVLASRWLADHPIGAGAVRIDVIGVLRPPSGPMSLRHVRDVTP